MMRHNWSPLLLRLLGRWGRLMRLLLLLLMVYMLLMTILWHRSTPSKWWQREILLCSIGLGCWSRACLLGSRGALPAALMGAVRSVLAVHMVYPVARPVRQTSATLTAVRHVGRWRLLRLWLAMCPRIYSARDGRMCLWRPRRWCLTHHLRRGLLLMLLLLLGLMMRRLMVLSGHRMIMYSRLPFSRAGRQIRRVRRRVPGGGRRRRRRRIVRLGKRD